MGLPMDCDSEQMQQYAQMLAAAQNPELMMGINRLAGQFTTDYVMGDEDEEYISEEEFQKGLDDQEKTIFNALVSSLCQNYLINLKKFLKRRMDHM